MTDTIFKTAPFRSPWAFRGEKTFSANSAALHQNWRPSVVRLERGRSRVRRPSLGLCRARSEFLPTALDTRSSAKLVRGPISCISYLDTPIVICDRVSTSSSSSVLDAREAGHALVASKDVRRWLLESGPILPAAYEGLNPRPAGASLSIKFEQRSTDAQIAQQAATAAPGSCQWRGAVGRRGYACALFARRPGRRRKSRNIAEHVGIPSAKAHRYLASLTRAGFVERSNNK